MHIGALQIKALCSICWLRNSPITIMSSRESWMQSAVNFGTYKSKGEDYLFTIKYHYNP